jgi:hypothetical protein
LSGRIGSFVVLIHTVLFRLFSKTNRIEDEDEDEDEET